MAMLCDSLHMLFRGKFTSVQDIKSFNAKNSEAARLYQVAFGTEGDTRSRKVKAMGAVVAKSVKKGFGFHDGPDLPEQTKRRLGISPDAYRKGRNGGLAGGIGGVHITK